MNSWVVKWDEGASQHPAISNRKELSKAHTKLCDQTISSRLHREIVRQLFTFAQKELTGRTKAPIDPSSRQKSAQDVVQYVFSLLQHYALAVVAEACAGILSALRQGLLEPMEVSSALDLGIMLRNNSKSDNALLQELLHCRLQLFWLCLDAKERTSGLQRSRGATFAQIVQANPTIQHTTLCEIEKMLNLQAVEEKDLLVLLTNLSPVLSVILHGSFSHRHSEHPQDQQLHRQDREDEIQRLLLRQNLVQTLSRAAYKCSDPTKHNILGLLTSRLSFVLINGSASYSVALSIAHELLDLTDAFEDNSLWEAAIRTVIAHALKILQAVQDAGLHPGNCYQMISRVADCYPQALSSPSLLAYLSYLLWKSQTPAEEQQLLLILRQLFQHLRGKVQSPDSSPFQISARSFFAPWMLPLLGCYHTHPFAKTLLTEIRDLILNDTQLGVFDEENENDLCIDHNSLPVLAIFRSSLSLLFRHQNSHKHTTCSASEEKDEVLSGKKGHGAFVVWLQQLWEGKHESSEQFLKVKSTQTAGQDRREDDEILTFLVMAGAFANSHPSAGSERDFQPIVKYLARLTGERPESGLDIISGLFYLLNEKSLGPESKHVLLVDVLPLLGRDEQCVKLLLKIAKSLLTVARTKDIGITFMTKLWSVQSGAFSRLRRLLLELAEEEEDNTDENAFILRLAAATSVRDICRKNPTRGVDFISIIQAHLKDDLVGVVALSIDSLKYLASGDTLDFFTAYKVVSRKKKMAHLDHPLVIRSLANFLAHGASDWEAHETTIVQIIDSLWAMTDSEFAPVRTAALQSLNVYPLEALGFHSRNGGGSEQQAQNLDEEEDERDRASDAVSRLNVLLKSEPDASAREKVEALAAKVADFEARSHHRFLQQKERIAAGAIKKISAAFPSPRLIADTYDKSTIQSARGGLAAGCLWCFGVSSLPGEGAVGNAVNSLLWPFISQSNQDLFGSSRPGNIKSGRKENMAKSALVLHESYRRVLPELLRDVCPLLSPSFGTEEEEVLCTSPLIAGENALFMMTIPAWMSFMKRHLTSAVRANSLKGSTDTFKQKADLVCEASASCLEHIQSAGLTLFDQTATNAGNLPLALAGLLLATEELLEDLFATFGKQDVISTHESLSAWTSPSHSFGAVAKPILDTLFALLKSWRAPGHRASNQGSNSESNRLSAPVATCYMALSFCVPSLLRDMALRSGTESAGMAECQRIIAVLKSDLSTVDRLPAAALSLGVFVSRVTPSNENRELQQTDGSTVSAHSNPNVHPLQSRLALKDLVLDLFSTITSTLLRTLTDYIGVRAQKKLDSVILQSLVESAVATPWKDLCASSEFTDMKTPTEGEQSLFLSMFTSLCLCCETLAAFGLRQLIVQVYHILRALYSQGFKLSALAVGKYAVVCFELGALTSAEIIQLCDEWTTSIKDLTSLKRENILNLLHAPSIVLPYVVSRVSGTSGCYYSKSSVMNLWQNLSDMAAAEDIPALVRFSALLGACNLLGLSTPFGVTDFRSLSSCLVSEESVQGVVRILLDIFDSSDNALLRSACALFLGSLSAMQLSPLSISQDGSVGGLQDSLGLLSDSSLLHRLLSDFKEMTVPQLPDVAYLSSLLSVLSKCKLPSLRYAEVVNRALNSGVSEELWTAGLEFSLAHGKVDASILKFTLSGLIMSSTKFLMLSGPAQLQLAEHMDKILLMVIAHAQDAEEAAIVAGKLLTGALQAVFSTALAHRTAQSPALQVAFLASIEKFFLMTGHTENDITKIDSINTENNIVPSTFSVRESVAKMLVNVLYPELPPLYKQYSTIPSALRLDEASATVWEAFAVSLAAFSGLPSVTDSPKSSQQAFLLTLLAPLLKIDTLEEKQLPMLLASPHYGSHQVSGLKAVFLRCCLAKAGMLSPQKDLQEARIWCVGPSAFPILALPLLDALALALCCCTPSLGLTSGPSHSGLRRPTKLLSLAKEQIAVVNELLDALLVNLEHWLLPLSLLAKVASILAEAPIKAMLTMGNIEPTLTNSHGAMRLHNRTSSKKDPSVKQDSAHLKRLSANLCLAIPQLVRQWDKALDEPATILATKLIAILKAVAVKNLQSKGEQNVALPRILLALLSEILRFGSSPQLEKDIRVALAEESMDFLILSSCSQKNLL